MCVVATAGTVNTGAIDDLSAIADLCREYDIWMHVDGAFGAFASITERYARLLNGLERADSIGFDLHKWMYMPFEVACVLVRDGQAHHDAFAMSADYIAETSRGVMAGGLPFAERGLELTRNFKALKVWMCLKAYGIDKFAALIEQNIDQASYLAALISASAELELLAPVALNVVNLRFFAPGLDDLQLDELNQELLLRLQESGIAVPSATALAGKYALRVAIVNHRSRFCDFDTLVEAVVAIGRQLLNEMAAASCKDAAASGAVCPAGDHSARLVSLPTFCPERIHSCL